MSLKNLNLVFIQTSSFPSPSTTSANSDLPLLDTLPTELQTSVLRYLRAPDRQMSLASALLKYWFIHRSARIPWDEVVISRTTAPHQRPWWDPGTSTTVQNREPANRFGLEFNVSHQAGLVGLVGAVIPPGTAPPLTKAATTSTKNTEYSTIEPETLSNGPVSLAPNPNPLPTFTPIPNLSSTASDSQSSSSAPNPTPLRLGLDITSSTEAHRTPTIKTQTELFDYISIFTEVFSPSDLSHMKYAPLESNSDSDSTNAKTNSNTNSKSTTIQQENVLLLQKLKRFYTFFALKEAYVKMTGEALLADWIRDISFRDVRTPFLHRQSTTSQDNNATQWTKIHLKTQVYLHSKYLDQVKLVTRGLEPGGFIVAVAVDGVAEREVGLSLDLDEEQQHQQGEVDEEDERGDGVRWIFLDWKRDIEGCARGGCGCLVG